MYGRTYIECNKTLDAYRKRYAVVFFKSNSFFNIDAWTFT